MKEIKASIYGIGIKDIDCDTTTCPFYKVWKNMFERCYSEVLHKRQPSYIGCTVSEEWKRFSNFKEWMEKQDWEGKQLDKDLLIEGNKTYSKEFCVFIPRSINMFTLSKPNCRGDWPIGVTLNKSGNRFSAKVRNPITNIRESLGSFDCPESAHKAWKTRKHELAVKLAEGQTDQRIVNALLKRYSV